MSGRKESPSAACIDSRSVKLLALVVFAGVLMVEKKIKGRNNISLRILWDYY